MLETKYRTFSGGVMRNVHCLTIDPSGVLHVNGDAIACETWMKSLCIEDGDGQEIYVGDILQNQRDKVLINWLVVDKGYCFAIKNIGLVPLDITQSFPVDCSAFFMDRKVIGNRYDNPELLIGDM